MLPRCFGVLGDPVAHSRSPAMHAAAFAALGLPYRYLPFHVPPEGLAAALRGAAALGFGGIVVKDDVGGSGLGRLESVLIFEQLSRRSGVNGQTP